MHIPRWKKWVSHLLPLTLETAASGQNPHLAVMLDRGRLQLLSGNAIYSWDDLYHNFTIAFGALDLEERQINNVLVLGFGLGSIPYILEKVYDLNYSYTAVEWDESVLALAAKYALPRLQSPVELITADAEIFVSVTDDRFDMIVVDIFEDDHTPERFESVDFLDTCAERLCPGGMLLYNRLHNTAKNRVMTERFFEDTFRGVFPNSRKIDTGGNWILVGLNAEK